MNVKAILIGMCRACIENAQYVREVGAAHWRRHWEKAMKDAALTRQLVAKVK